ncbi:type II toxin-antitoxin system PemK/MazF family toxin [Solidesulfovibrio sp.]
MGQFIAGTVVYLPFPCADLAPPKNRPALVLTLADGGDCVLAMISTKSHHPGHEVALTQSAFDVGGLPRDSIVRCDRLFTAAPAAITKTLGRLSDKKLSEAGQKAVVLFTGSFVAARKRR